jgi:hypothetical protein
VSPQLDAHGYVIADEDGLAAVRRLIEVLACTRAPAATP